MAIIDRTVQVDLDDIGLPNNWVLISNPMWLRQKDLNDLSRAQNDPEVLSRFLGRLIKHWKIVDLDGEEIPFAPDADSINELPLVVLRHIFEVVARELNVPLSTATVS